MAKRKKSNRRLTRAAVRVGSAAGRAAGSVNRLRRRGAGLRAEVGLVRDTARKLVADLKPAGRHARRAAATAARASRRAAKKVTPKRRARVAAKAMKRWAKGRRRK